MYFSLLMILLVHQAKSAEVRNAPVLMPFVSDGCSAPATFSEKKYGDCCISHDIAYWAGGTREDKNDADANLIACIKSKGASEFTTGMWQTILQNFGDNRWGAGWKPRRGFLALNEKELEEVAKRKSSIIGQLPIVQSYSAKRECPSRVKRLLDSVTALNLDKNEKAICYPLIPKDTETRVGMFMITSQKCRDGYFIYQGKRGKGSETIGGYGMCADKIREEKRTNYFPKVSYETLSPNGTGEK